MNLDDLERFGRLDPAGMQAHIDGLPGQLASAWEMGRSLALSTGEPPRQAVLAGMGGSAIGADLAAAYAAQLAPIPIVVWRDYGLPAWARGPETLVVVSSHSGNTEETLTAYDAARAAQARLLAITTGGELARRASADGVDVWRFEHRGQPRAAVGFSCALSLAALHRLGVLADPAAELADTVAAMRAQQSNLHAEVPAAANPAKRDWLYFVAIPGDEQRKHFFTDSYDEFLQFQAENPPDGSTGEAGEDGTGTDGEGDGAAAAAGEP